jgi:hypothetical protein
MKPSLTTPQHRRTDQLLVYEKGIDGTVETLKICNSKPSGRLRFAAQGGMQRSEYSPQLKRYFVKDANSRDTAFLE